MNVASRVLEVDFVPRAAVMTLRDASSIFMAGLAKEGLWWESKNVLLNEWLNVLLNEGTSVKKLCYVFVNFEIASVGKLCLLDF